MSAQAKPGPTKATENPRCQDCGERAHDPNKDGFWEWALRVWKHRCAKYPTSVRPWFIRGNVVWREE